MNLLIKNIDEIKNCDIQKIEIKIIVCPHSKVRTGERPRTANVCIDSDFLKVNLKKPCGYINSSAESLINSGKLEKEIALDFCKNCESENCITGTGCLIKEALNIIEDFPSAVE